MSHSSSLRFAAVSFAFLLLSGTAMAQAIPTTVEPGRVQRDISRDLRPSTIATPAELGTAPEVAAPRGAKNVTFVLKDVIVEGGQKLSRARIHSIYAGKIGKTVSLAEIYGVANQITRAYRDNGYLLSRAIVPKQQIKNGIVRIQIIEGFVSGYTIDGKDFGGRQQLDAYAKRLVASGTLSAGNLERYLLLMNDLPGIQVRSILAPSTTVFGGTDLRLIVEQKKFAGSASIDNFGNKFLGPQRVTLTGSANSLFGGTDQVNGAFLWAPAADELEFYNVSYGQNIGNEGTRASVNMGYTHTDPTLPASLGGLLDPEGESYILGFNLAHPFIRSRALNVTGAAGFDFTKNKTDFNASPIFAPLETEDDQRIARLSAQINYLDRFAGYNAASGTVSKGLDILGSSGRGDANLSRPQGDPSFTKLNMEASRLQRLYGSLTGLIGLSGQYSFNPLLASEEFGFGGTDFGRGYDFSEITGDQGLAGKAELAYGFAPNYKYLETYQLYTFYDLGKVWNRDPAAGQEARESAASAGIGTRLNFLPNLRGDTFIAKPLTRDVTSRGEHGDDWRFKFSVTSNF